MSSTKFLRTALLLALPAATAAFAGCTESENTDSLGEAEVELSTVPSGVQCINIVAIGGGNVFQLGPVGHNFPVTAGTTPVTLALGALPTGTVHFTGTAYNAACPDAMTPPSGDPSWIAEPIVAEIVPGIAERLEFEFHRNLPGTGTADFQDSAVSVVPSSRHTMALMGDGTLRAWGSQYDGQFGNAAQWDQRPLPGPGGVGLTDLLGVASGVYHSCAWDATRVWCWGSNSAGQLGDGTTSSRYTPTLVNGPWSATGISSVAAGANNTCLVAMDGRTYCWGGNSYGESGQPPSARVLQPTEFLGWRFQSVALGTSFGCGVYQTDSTVYCWGLKLGPQTTPPTYSNYPSATYMRAAVDIAAGSDHVCAVRADGKVWCWGRNSSGELGVIQTGTGAVQDPLQIQGIDDATTLALTANASCVIRTGGTVSCWGNNMQGTLGDGTGNNNWVPVQVRDLTGVVDLRGSLWSNTICAALPDGEARCWGSGAFRQIGDGGTSNRFVPTKVDF